MTGLTCLMTALNFISLMGQISKQQAVTFKLTGFAPVNVNTTKVLNFQICKQSDPRNWQFMSYSRLGILIILSSGYYCGSVGLKM